MNRWFEELDCRRTPLGELVLQRRRVLALDGAEAVEVRLNGEYLMSSLFHEAEEELARLGLGALPAGGANWDVVVGGLGLGYTAAAALAFPQVSRLVVVEALEPVIDWHRQGLVPNGRELSADPRCEFHLADFFALARGNGTRCCWTLIIRPPITSTMPMPISTRRMACGGWRVFSGPAACLPCGRMMTRIRCSWSGCATCSDGRRDIGWSSTIR